MTWALITDLHANLQAFEAVLADARAKGATRFALLGDFVGYGANPSEVLDLALALHRDGAIAVQGNHDAATAAGAKPSMHADARQVLEWTRAQLSEAQLQWLADLPLRARAEECLFTHANAYDPGGWDYIMGRTEAVRSLTAAAQAGARFNVCGHMHDPRLFHLSGTGKAGEFAPQAGVNMPLPAHRKWLLIPGSCGQPRDGNPAACYALWEPGDGALTDGWVRFERVPYDVDGATQALRASSLPAALSQRMAQRLERGE